jgi:hypothetical protein
MATFMPACYGHVLGATRNAMSAMTAAGVTVSGAGSRWVFNRTDAVYVDGCAALGCRVCPGAKKSR